MARYNAVKGELVTLLDGVEATGAGTAVETNLVRTTYQVQGITTATVVIQVSNDGTNFVNSGLSFTADGVGAVEGPFKHVRANCTAWTSGAITVTAVV